MNAEEPSGRALPIPIGLAGAAVLFWGWQTGWLAIAVPLAMVLETGRALKDTRFSFPLALEDEGINRVADLCSLLLIAVGAYLLITLESPRAARTVIGMAHWLPVTLAPLALVQAYATRRPLDLSVLFVTLRARPPTGVQVDFGFIYVIACVIAAAAANVRTEMYYAGVAVFAAWALWNLRSRRYPRIAPFAVLFLASILGYGGHIVLNRLQAALTDWASELADSSEQTNPYRTRTDIGHIGQLKLSDRILLRVTVPEGERMPLLIHRASYNAYGGQAWIARRSNFESLPGDPANGWSLKEGPRRDAPVEILEYTRTGEAILSLPTRTAHVAGLPPADAQRNSLGSVKIQTAPGFIRYRALRGEGDARESNTASAAESPPDEQDTAIPERERAPLRDIAGQLKLKGLPPAEARRRIERFFDQHFTYSTWQEAAPHGVRTPLANFLTKTRSGHCEYFATATALLLREAGIPTRYATGFSVQERSQGSDYVVRERHAHAWVRAWIDGSWVDIDTTPGQWFAVEAGQASGWQALGDAWAWLKFSWGRFQTSEEDAVPRPVLFGLLAALFLWLLWRVFGSTRRRQEHAAHASAAPAWPGVDSEYYRIERLLAERGLVRGDGEPLFEWLGRLSRAGLGDPSIEELKAIARLHYRLRFDPQPIDAPSREELRARAHGWIEAHPSSKGAPGQSSV